jgi:hypothetical protein
MRLPTSGCAPKGWLAPARYRSLRQFRGHTVISLDVLGRLCWVRVCSRLRLYPRRGMVTALARCDRDDRRFLPHRYRAAPDHYLTYRVCREPLSMRLSSSDSASAKRRFCCLGPSRSVQTASCRNSAGMGMARTADNFGHSCRLTSSYTVLRERANFKRGITRDRLVPCTHVPSRIRYKVCF